MKETTEEFVAHKFEYRCPYCDQPVSYDHVDLRKSENTVACPSCQKVFIKVVFDSMGEEGNR